MSDISVTMGEPGRAKTPEERKVPSREALRGLRLLCGRVRRLGGGLLRVRLSHRVTQLWH
jgi:hypothetical protein